MTDSLKDLFLSNIDKVDVPAGEPKNTDADKPTDTVVTKDEPKVDAPAEPIKPDDAKPEPPKRGTAEHKISTLVKKNKTLIESVSAERDARVKLEANLMELQKKVEALTGGPQFDQTVDQLPADKVEELVRKAKEEARVELEKESLKTEVQRKASEFSELLKTEYEKYYDEDTQSMDDDIVDELQEISRVYNSNPDKWIAYVKKNGVKSFANFVMDRSPSTPVTKAADKATRLTADDSTGKRKNGLTPTKDKPKTIAEAMKLGLAELEGND